MESFREECRTRWHGVSVRAAAPRILVIDSDDLSLRKNRTALVRAGYPVVESHTSMQTASSCFDDFSPDIVFLEITPGEVESAGFEFMTRLREHLYRGIVVVVSNRPTVPMVYRAARLGATEFLVKSHLLDIGVETRRLMNRRAASDTSIWHSDAFLTSGFFASMGLTKGEINILSAFADGFPKHQEIADRLNKKNPYIRKTFSRIYEKVGTYLPIENSAQLSHLVTVCSLFH